MIFTIKIDLIWVKIGLTFPQGGHIPNGGNPENQRFEAIFQEMTGCSKSAKNRRFTRNNARTVKEGLM